MAKSSIVKHQQRGFYTCAAPDWTEGAAVRLAREQNLELGPDHFELLDALQRYFACHDEPTTNTRELHDALNERFHSRGGMKYLYHLFPGGPVAQGCPLAGLAIPAGAIDQSFGSVQ